MNEILQKLKDIEQVLLQTKEVFTVDDLSRYTGFSKSFIYKLTANRQIPFFKPFGKIILFKKEQVTDWLLSNEVTTAGEIHSSVVRFEANQRMERGQK